jgi:hypothetical protein
MSYRCAALIVAGLASFHKGKETRCKVLNLCFDFFPEILYSNGQGHRFCTGDEPAVWKTLVWFTDRRRRIQSIAIKDGAHIVKRERGNE